MARVRLGLIGCLLLGGCSIETEGTLVRPGRDGGTGDRDACPTCTRDGSGSPDVLAGLDAPVPLPDAGCVARGGECEPGAVAATETEACGNCGTRTRTRTCGASCAWEGEWTACTGEGECAPGSELLSWSDCSGCTQLTVRICSGECRPGDPMVYGRCGTDTCAGFGGYAYCEGVYRYMGLAVECCGSDRWEGPGGC